jgi:uncharacterized protein involved in exopolysaccharide biosynthesis
MAAVESDAITLRMLLAEVRRSWHWIAIFVFAGLALGIAAGFLMRPKYKVEVSLMVATQSQSGGGLSSLASQLGGVAALAGLATGGQGERYEAIEYLKSKDLAANFIAEQNLLPVLFAGRWDATNKRWRESNPDEQPSLADGVRYFSRSIRGVTEDRRTGVVVLSVTWRDRKQAAAWAEGLVQRANAQLRDRAINEARTSLAYLEREANSATQVPIREALYRLVEGQLKTAMMANARPDYAFRVVDSARVPDREDFVSPKRFLFGALGGMAGLLLAALLVMIRAAQRPAA